MSNYGGSYDFDDEHRPHGHGAMSQETINQALANANRNPQGNPNPPSQTQRTQPANNPSSYEPDRPGISRKDTTSRRDPLTGDLIEEYSGTDGQGPAMRAHYNWDAPHTGPNTTGGQYASGGTQSSATSQRPGEVRRTNTTISYDAGGNRVEEHDGEGSLQIRAMYNEDDDPSNVYRPPGPARHQSERSSQDHRY